MADKTLSASASSSRSAGLVNGTSSSQSQQPHLEATARQLNKVFSACVADRNPDMALSRKWATYRVVAILFRTYFKVSRSYLDWASSRI